MRVNRREEGGNCINFSGREAEGRRREGKEKARGRGVFTFQ
jgi:hypothetical protein